MFIKKKINNLKYIFYSLIIIIFIFVIYLIELTLNLYDISGYKYRKWSRLERSPFEIYKQKKDQDFVIKISPSHYLDYKFRYEIYPLSGISNKITINCNEGGYWSDYFSDRYGFSNPDHYWNKNRIPFLLIGDSFTHGACVQYKDSIAGNISAKLEKDSAVINLGYGGNGPLREYASLKEYLVNINPERVIWIFSEANDIIDFENEKKNSILKKYLMDDNFNQNLINKQTRIDEIANDILINEYLYFQNAKNKFLNFDKFSDWNKIIKLEKFRGRLGYFFNINTNVQNYDISDEFYTLINKFKKLSEDKNFKLYFVYLPNYPANYKSQLDQAREQSYKKIISIINKHEIKIIDLNEELFKNYDDTLSLFPYRVNGHYNELGYKLISDAILKKIDFFEK